MMGGHVRQHPPPAEAVQTVILEPLREICTKAQMSTCSPILKPFCIGKSGQKHSWAGVCLGQGQAHAVQTMKCGTDLRQATAHPDSEGSTVAH